MAGTRSYKRNRSGQFASSGSATVTTVGKSGGFASATHRANVANTKAARAHRKVLAKNGVKAAVVGGAAAAVIGAGAKNAPTGTVSNLRASVRTAANIVKGRNQ